MISYGLSNNSSALIRVKSNILKFNSERAHNISQAIYEEARDLTAVRYFSPAQLKKLDYPYAVRWPVGTAGIDDRIINYQTGELHRSIGHRVTKRASGSTITVWAGAPYSKYLLKGTDRMRKRNFLSLAYERSKKKIDSEDTKLLNKIEKEIHEEVRRNRATSKPKDKKLI